jgi:hypothetical protein
LIKVILKGQINIEKETADTRDGEQTFKVKLLPEFIYILKAIFN